tara:strand:+ start:24233 stop:24604 length:372 start_codon:yes stop_codon:yes gene_type:complete
MNTTFRIGLKNCSFFARHGVLEAEQQLGQRFFVDVDMHVCAGTALSHDDLDSTVDYGVAFQAIEKIVTQERYQLIEALAYRIGSGLCETFPPIKRVSVTIRKPAAPVPGVLDHAEVCVEYIPE